MPKGCDANGSARVCTTVIVDGLMMLIVAAGLLATHRSPLGATASVRGPGPTAISATRVLVAASDTVTELLSWLATHTRPPPWPSNTMLLEIAGLLAVSGRWITCVVVCDCAGLPSDSAVTVT